MIFTPLTYWHLSYYLKPMQKQRLIDELNTGRETRTISVAQYNKDSCLHKTLIHDYQKRSLSGELAKLREIFDNSALNFEMKTRKIDMNVEDEKMDDQTLETMWSIVEDDTNPIII